MATDVSAQIEMFEDRCPETSVINYQPTPQSVSEELSPIYLFIVILSRTVQPVAQSLYRLSYPNDNKYINK